MVETMALADDMVGLTLTETLESQVLCGVTIPDDGVGLKLSVVKDTVGHSRSWSIHGQRRSNNPKSGTVRTKIWKRWR